MAAHEPDVALTDFISLLEEMPVATLNERNTAAMVTHLEETYGGFDQAPKSVALAHSTNAVRELRFRRRVFTSAVESLAGAWFCGYVFARTVYGPVTPLKYSESEEQSKANGQGLIDYAEAIEIDEILYGLGDATKSFSNGLEADPEYQPIMKKLGARQGSGAVLASWAMGVAIAIAEHEIFEVATPR